MSLQRFIVKMKFLKHTNLATVCEQLEYALKKLKRDGKLEATNIYVHAEKTIRSDLSEAIHNG